MSKGGGLFVINTIGCERREPTEDEAEQIEDLRLPLEGRPRLAGRGAGSARRRRTAPAGGQAAADPWVQVNCSTATRTASSRQDQINGGKSADLPARRRPAEARAAFLTGPAIDAIISAGRFFVTVFPITPSVEFLVGPTPTVLVAVDASGPAGGDDQAGRPRRRRDGRGRFARPALGRRAGQGRSSWQPGPPRHADPRPAPTRGGTVAVYHYAGAEAPEAQDGMATVEVRARRRRARSITPPRARTSCA